MSGLRKSAGLWIVGPVLAAGLCGCAPELLDVKQVSESPREDTREVVPVGGYQVLGGEWASERSDEVIGAAAQPLTLLINAEGNVVEATAPEHGVRLRCEAHYRVCLGQWNDNAGHGKLVLTFSTDFTSFTGSYDGTREGRDVGRSTWTGTKR